MRLGLLAAARITGPAIIEPARSIDGVEVVAVAARSVERAREKAADWGVPTVHDSYEELLADESIDAIYIATPAALHHRWTLAALAAGKHVLCEKPFAANATEARQMVDAADAAGLVLMEAFHWRYHPLVGQVRELLDEPRVGSVTEVHGTFCLPEGHIRPGDIRWDLPLGGGGLMDLGCYPLQWVRWVVGAEPEVVAASAECPVPEVDGRLRAELRWQLPDRTVTGSIECSMIGPDRDIALRILGERGRIDIANPLAPQHGARIEVRSSDGTVEEVPVPAADTTTYAHQLVAFRDTVATGTPVPTGGSDAIATMELIDACYRAAGLSPRPSLG